MLIPVSGWKASYNPKPKYQRKNELTLAESSKTLKNQIKWT